ncbi:S-layer homology domain-containing protein [Peribacillus loiseleuriae]|uniref:SLH domain-containing protein n=1 Tax=Peribacillus loiseleuriae TaxID=1679170 RepID=A0A0K9GYZ0_9BACI|nr:S-layer homology domain-containing protein [Peribacillus loiseleuriae]KMY51868.1 hypothetical protein AC625_21990 [Peribacillus loiseleuriae]
MKKYPLSKKGLQAMLATTIAVAPIVTTGVIVQPTQVKAATTIDQEINTLAERFFIFYKAANFTPSIPTLTFDQINSAAGGVINLSSEKEKTAFTNLLNNTAALIYTKYSSSNALAQAIKDFRGENATDFNTVFDNDGNVVADQLISFVKDLEGNLETAIIAEALKGSMSYSAVISNAVSTTLKSGQYSKLQGKLSDIDLSVEKLFLLQENLNNSKIDPNKDYRSAMMQSAFSEKGATISNNNNKFTLNVPVNKAGISTTVSFTTSIKWETSNPNIATFSGNTLQPKANGTVDVYATIDGIKLSKLTDVNVKVGNSGGGGGGPVTPPIPEKPGKIELPAGSTEKVTENGAVITKISADKVQGIVDLITSEKSVVPLKLEKGAAGVEVKASVPASLFTELAKKNKKAIVEVLTDEASYKLPATEINVAVLAKKLGVNESDVQIIVSVNVVDAKAVADTVGKNKLKPVSKVIEFTVEAVSGDKKESVATFSTYVERDIVSENNFNAGRSVAVKLNEDGTFSSLPTLFNGKTATIKSLTNSKYTIVENDKTFPDVDKKHWAEKYIDTLASKYIIAGNDNGKYAPQEDMTRAQFTVLLVRALGLPAAKYDNHFKDVKGNEWFNAKDEVMAAVNYGIIYGKENGRFAPNDKITRAEAATMIHRAMNLDFINFDATQLDKKKKIGDFKDASKVGAWAKESVEAVYQAGIFGGKDNGTFDPNGNTKRDQMAKILAEFLVSAKLMNDIK